MRKRTGELIELPLFGSLWEQDSPGQEAEAPVVAPHETQRATEDAGERVRALDVGRSWIVEAPAGSGKTGLLIQRYLKLLAEGEVERPEQVMAITFTKAATAEIRERVTLQLDQAAEGRECRDEFERTTRELAEAVLRRDREMGWALRDAPRRMDVRTIDSVCAEIARSLPLTTGGGGGLTAVEEPQDLYREAARRTLRLLGGADAVLTEAIETVLLHRDADLGDCTRLIAEMLAAREQWGELLPMGPSLTEQWLDSEVRRRLDATLEHVVCEGLSELKRAIPEELLEELTTLAREMANAEGYKGQPSPMTIFAGVQRAPGETVEDLRHWQLLVRLMVTADGGWRRQFQSRWLLFEWDKSHTRPMTALIASLQEQPGVIDAIEQFHKLPPPLYPDDQWIVAKALFRVLHRALLELQLVFAERGECDFAEPALMARAAIRAERGGADAWEAATGVELRHLLVDEMQDTSMSQYELLRGLTAGWGGEGKTVFLVGDPKQSIYLFRQARVEKFVETMRSEHLGEVELGCLRLTANFRSQGGLVREFNREFRAIFPQRVEDEADVPFVEAEAVRAERLGAAGEGGAEWHATGADGGTTPEAKAERRRLVKQSAREIRGVIEDWMAKPLPAGRTDPWRIAVLVRGRPDLREIVAELRREKDGRVAVPFRAVNVEPLAERREVLDLLALTRALKHPADRVAWWAVLMAPWCGLRLRDAHALAGEDNAEFRQWTVMELVTKRGTELSEDGIARLQRIWPVLEAAVAKAGRVPLPELVERTWRSLGGDASLDEADMSNALRFLELLEAVARQNGGEVEIAALDDRMKRLFARPAETPGAVELVTIHGAKGLEWDMVVLPRLEKSNPNTTNRLLEWEEMSSEGEAARVVLAPVAAKGGESEALRSWVTGLRRERERAERRRQFYVACTRAREELHLFGTASIDREGTRKPQTGSLLEAAWPAAERWFQPPAETGVLLEMPGRADEAQEGVIDLAAAGEQVRDERREERPRVIERLPASFDALARFGAALETKPRPDAGARERFARPEGSFAARSFGNAVHAFLELAARRLADGGSTGRVADEVRGWRPRVSALLRGDGVGPLELDAAAGRVLAAVRGTLVDATGRWLLGRRVDARSEYALRTAAGESVRLDRVFRAGTEPLSEGDECLWVVDYKTGSHGSAGLEPWLAEEQEKYRGQMETYARALGQSGVRVGLWFPIVRRLVWWIV